MPGSPLRTNHLLWLGPLVSIVGFLSYWAVFARWAATRDVPWVNMIILAVGLYLSFGGLRRAWPRGGWRRHAGGGALFVSTALAALLLVYCFALSYSLPPSDQALTVGQSVPAIALPDQNGREVDLGAAAGGQTVLVFYRGHW